MAALLVCVISVVTESAGFAQVIAPPPGFSPGSTNSGLDAPPATIAPPSNGTVRDYGIFNPGLGFGSQPSQSPRPIPDPGAPGGVFGDPMSLMPFPNWWGGVEALAWWTKASPVPVPLVTDGGAIGTGSPVVLGDQNLALPVGGGARFTLGAGVGAGHLWGVEGSYFFVNNSGAGQGVTSDGHHHSAELSFPFYNPTIPGEDSSPIALPGAFAGTAIVSAQSFIQGVDLNVLRNVVNNGGDFRFDLLGGFRYINLRENLAFITSSPNVFPNPPAYFNTFDTFNTSNNFYGAQLGGRASFDNGLVFFNATGKLGLGSTVESVGINGSTVTNDGGYASAVGGYLTQPSNIGNFSTTQFAVAPEMTLNLGFYLSPWAKFLIGYNFLYISSVARPGNQIDRVINPSQSSAISGNFPATLSGPARPISTVQGSDIWIQGLNFGFEFRY
jgi:hypothetical protein